MQTKTSGCGCGGGRAGGCGCGGASAEAIGAFAPAAMGAATCAPCETAAFVRPRFFAGQLLTEDDLGALIDYTLAKQRLHNTHLLGAGVACGLAVACGPRGPQGSSQVVVEAGYASRRLRQRPRAVVRAHARSGADDPRAGRGAQRGCAEPCLPTAAGASGTMKAATGASHSYDLYIRYAERPDQPVAAYPVGDDCDAGAPGASPRDPRGRDVRAALPAVTRGWTRDGPRTPTLAPGALARSRRPRPSSRRSASTSGTTASSPTCSSGRPSRSPARPPRSTPRSSRPCARAAWSSPSCSPGGRPRSG